MTAAEPSQVDAPFGLSQGLRLESSGVVVPWEADPDEMSRIGSPEALEFEGGVYLKWANQRVFGGIEVDVSFRSDLAEAFGTPGYRAFNLQWTVAAGLGSEEAAFDELRPILLSRFGEPHRLLPPTPYLEHVHPGVEWAYGAVRVRSGVAMQFTEYLFFQAATGPDPADAASASHEG